MINKDKFLLLVSDEKSKTIKKNRQRIRWRLLIRIKNKIHLWWLNITDR
jgi:hypothetical protein